MKYAILIYHGTTPLPGSDAWEMLSKKEQQAIYADYAALNQTPGLTPTIPLGLPPTATTVRVQDGQTVSTKGPVGSVKEALGGFAIFEADSLDAAIELASRIPQARLGGAVEVRPSEKYW